MLKSQDQAGRRSSPSFWKDAAELCATREVMRPRQTFVGQRGGLSAMALCVLGCASGATGGAPPAPEPESRAPRAVTYQPFSASYRATSRRHVEQEFNGQRTATQVLMVYYVSTELVGTPSGLQATLTIDSVPLLSGLPEAEARSVRGATFTAALSATGEVRDFRGSDRKAELLRQLSLGLREFFPRLPSSAADSGKRWADTAETSAGTRDLTLTIQSVNNHEVMGWREFGGVRSLHIVTVSDYTLRGTGFEAGQEYLLEGAGTAHAHQYIAPDGRYLGSVTTDTLHSSASLPAMGTIIPIVQTRTDTLTIVR